ncbi:MAG: heme o synthase [Fimbriimonadaceae bacterium]
MSRYAWLILFYTVPVILFGAFVRAGLHGDGCGAHWPGCNGALIPDGTSLSESIEFGHRASSGLLGILVFVLFAWAFRSLQKGHPGRKAALAVLFFTVTEAAIGAGLVKFQWVAQDLSYERIYAMSFHLVNTFFLLGSMVLCAHFAAGGEKVRLRGHGPVGTAVVVGLAGLLLLGITGAISALGDTIFPVKSLAEGLQRDIAATSHIAERLRMFHPLIATSVALYMLFACGFVAKHRPEARTMAKWAVGLFMVQMAFGIANLLLLAPIWMQIVHLALSDAIWIATVLMAVSALAASRAEARESLTGSAALKGEPAAERRGFVAMLKSYVALTKPRVVSLLVFVSVAAMFVAERGFPGLWPIVLVVVGGYMAAGAANTFNMVYERDLDGAMERTSHRPTVTHAVSNTEALVFGFVLALGSFAILWSAFNLLTAMMALAGLLFYFFIYTMALKRRTTQNIVIGGAAGAFPPLVGYAAVTGRLDPIAWYLFAIIFLWTPVHFWALALMIKEDYAKAGVPMLPVVKGDRATVVQIGVYTLLTAVVTVMPLFQGQVGWVYLVGASALNAGLVLQSLQLIRHTDRPHAKSLFKYSMVYLALLFVTVALDRAVVAS